MPLPQQPPRRPGNLPFSPIWLALSLQAPVSLPSSAGPLPRATSSLRSAVGPSSHAPTRPQPAVQTARPGTHRQIYPRESRLDPPVAETPSTTHATAEDSTPVPIYREPQSHSAAAASSTPLPPPADVLPPRPHAAAPTVPCC